jgi:hypothetical protein
MSDVQTPREFEERVGLAVDPIPASPQRKGSMREELLGHLRGAYEQELAENKVPETAMAAAINRFGNLEIIREELRQSVPVLERLIFQFKTREAVIFRWIPEREQIMLRWILVGVALVAIGMGLILPALAKVRAGEKFTTGAAIPFAIGVALVLIGLFTIGLKIVKRLSGDQRATPR